MGDYTTIIVSARIKIDNDKKTSFEQEFRKRLPLVDSAYHATAPFLRIENGTVSCITQAKYNHGVKEFMDWFRPMVVRGLGPNNAWIINFCEYSKEPKIEYLREKEW